MRTALPQRIELGFLNHLVDRRLSLIGFRKIKDETFLNTSKIMEQRQVNYMHMYTFF